MEQRQEGNGPKGPGAPAIDLAEWFSAEDRHHNRASAEDKANPLTKTTVALG